MKLLFRVLNLSHFRPLSSFRPTTLLSGNGVCCFYWFPFSCCFCWLACSEFRALTHLMYGVVIVVVFFFDFLHYMEFLKHEESWPWSTECVGVCVYMWEQVVGIIWILLLLHFFHSFTFHFFFGSLHCSECVSVVILWRSEFSFLFSSIKSLWRSPFLITIARKMTVQGKKMTCFFFFVCH